MFNRKAFAGGILAATLVLTAGCAAGDPAGEASTGGSITVAAAQGIPQLNPAIRTFAWEEVLFPLLWNGLSKTDSQGDIVPDLAESWESTADQKTWTFALRDGVTFSNGEALTAAKVVASFEYYLDGETATQEANKISMVSGVEAIDELTVQFTLDEPVATFPSAIVWVKVLDIDSLDTIDKDPIGTGPFTVEAFTPDDSVTLVRNDDYFGEAPALDEIVLVTAAESTSAVTGLRSGDLDVLWSVPAGDVDQLEGESSISIVRPESPSQWPSWEMDTTSAPFNDVRARQALAYAIDRETILEAAYYGQGVVSPTNNALSENNPWFNADLTDYSYDLEMSKKLFAEAGVNEGDTLVWWGIAGSYPEWNTSGEILQASLKEIGINLDIQNNDIGTWVDDFYPAGKSYPGKIVPNFQSTPPEPAYSLNFYLPGRCECNWVDDEFLTAFSGALAEPDADARKAQWATVQSVINEQVPLIVPLQSTVATGTSSELSGVWVEGGGQLHLESVTR
ncbi:ABC transporter substrate-binding protein [Salinibacterium sp. M195]|uniref:ABC transporter substrate-binding protein n=1 Tax=Salinibacterium sp. M195 TaxID=2583374 RepID=UPI001C629466|nr:ABC transporter substrate-binding protein [Salinibacterium sp. M195]QYH36368.1 ABC transporter substrate-binding protein [Salinibacterium sp. M195]